MLNEQNVFLPVILMENGLWQFSMVLIFLHFLFVGPGNSSDDRPFYIFFIKLLGLFKAFFLPFEVAAYNK